MHNLESLLESSLRFWDKNLSNLGLTTRPSDSQQKKRTCRIVDFAIPADHWVKLKESEKRDKYLDLARELKKLWNLKVTVIPIVIGALGTITKGLVQGLEDLKIRRMEAILITALLKSARILRRVLETWGDLGRLAVTQTSMKNHLLTLMWKILK